MDDASVRVARANQLIDDEPSTARTAPGTLGRRKRLCAALSRALPATGIGLSLLTDDSYGGGTVAASDAASRALE